MNRFLGVKASRLNGEIKTVRCNNFILFSESPGVLNPTRVHTISDCGCRTAGCCFSVVSVVVYIVYCVCV